MTIADRIAFGREPDDYRHAALMNHPRTDWAFTVARRYLYETRRRRAPGGAGALDVRAAGELVGQDAARGDLSPAPRDAWLRRLAEGGRRDARRGSRRPSSRIWADAQAGLRSARGEEELLRGGILPRANGGASRRDGWRAFDRPRAAWPASRRRRPSRVADGRTPARPTTSPGSTASSRWSPAPRRRDVVTPAALDPRGPAVWAALDEIARSGDPGHQPGRAGRDRRVRSSAARAASGSRSSCCRPSWAARPSTSCGSRSGSGSARSGWPTRSRCG